MFLRNVNMFVRNASPRGHMYFMCPMFSLSGPCEFFFCILLFE